MSAIQQLLAGTGVSGEVVYATWNPADKDPNINLTNGDLTATASGGAGGVRSTASELSGSYYYECEVVNTASLSQTLIGVANAAADLTGTISTSSAGNNSTIVFRFDAIVFRNSTNLGDQGASNVNGDIIMIAVDIDNGRFYVGRNGTWFNSADPAAGTGSFPFTPDGAIYPVVSCGNTTSWTARFDPATYSYTAPSGFDPWTV